MELIDKQAAIDALAKILPTDPMKNEYTKGNIVGVALALKYVMQLPSVQPERTGKWIRISPAKIYECSLCGKNVMTADIDEYHFCHGCGARMKN